MNFRPALAFLVLVAALASAAQAQSKAFIGVEVEENAETLEDVGDHVGVRITAVADNSPASAAGLAKGDVIETLNGVSFQWPDKFYAAVAALPTGKRAILEILRDDVGLEVEVTPSVRKAERRAAKVRSLIETERVGVRFRALTRDEARAAGLPAAEGVGIAGFWGNSPWRRDGVKPGDLLHRMNARPVHDPREVIRRIRSQPIGTVLRLQLVRAGKRIEVVTVASARARRTERVLVPLLFNYRSETEEESEWGVLFDIVQTHYKGGKRTTTILWVISWSTGEGNALREIPVETSAKVGTRRPIRERS